MMSGFLRVTSDFDNASLQQDITPVLMFNCADWVGVAGIEMSTANLETLRSIQKTWETIYPEEIFNSMTLNDYIKDKGFYLLEDIMYKGFKTFVLLAIVIGCMGLYGLVSFLALQRRKEIGIRKVLGASSKGILFLFPKEFARLTLIAFLIAAPIA